VVSIDMLWGHTGPDVCEGLSMTQEQADALLAPRGPIWRPFVTPSVTESIATTSRYLHARPEKSSGDYLAL
jgi:hypothetical protein